MTEKTAPAAAAATTTAAAAAPKTEKPKTVGGFALTAKISLGTGGADNKKYDGDANNPKRKGSKSFDKFAKYKDGMTVEQAAAAGITGADLSWDTKHGFIKIA